MVIEYRGDLLRRTAADAREKAYQAAGKDCYLFTVNEECVIDATMTGGIGRFTVSRLSHKMPLLLWVGAPNLGSGC